MKDSKLKQKFFALYWGQNICNNKRYDKDKNIDTPFENIAVNLIGKDDYLELKSIYDISNEDAINVSNSI